jgi:hypothetical protein
VPCSERVQFSPRRSLQVKLPYRAEVFAEHVEELKSRVNEAEC